MRVTNKIPFYLSAASFFISSMAIWFMPLGSFTEGGNGILAVSLALIFWLGFIMGFVFLHPVSIQRKRDKGYRGNNSFSFIRFFSNKPAIVSDALLIAGVIALIVSLLLIRTLPGWVTLAATFMTVFGLEMHGLFNGKNYEWLRKQAYGNKK